MEAYTKYIPHVQFAIHMLGNHLSKGYMILPTSPEPSRLKSSVTSSETVLCKLAIHAGFSDGFDIQKGYYNIKIYYYRFVAIP